MIRPKAAGALPDIVLALVVKTGSAGEPGAVPAGDGSYRISLRSRPVDGRANDELAGFLAACFGVGAACVEIVRGRTSRRKLVRIRAPETLPGWFAG